MTPNGILSLAAVVLASMTVAAQSKSNSAGPRLHLQITSDKSVYKVGEPIMITITLRNDGDEIMWMSKPRGVGRYAGEFYVDAVAPDGRLLPNKSPVMALSADGPAQAKTNSMQDFLCKRVPMFPGEFWGISRSIEDAFVSLKEPGRYQVTAKYNEHAPEGFSKEQLKDLQREVRFPIQTESVVSEPLILEIH
jgi:hypothetical protein